MDSLCDQMNYSKLSWKPSFHFISDLNTIIDFIKFKKVEDYKIFDICMECNNNLNWNSDKFITILDYNWLISHGRTYINSKLVYPMNNNSFNELVDLFNLQLE